MGPYYEADGITLYHGDCREVAEWLTADVLVTDPPYGIGWRRRPKESRGDAGHAGIAGDSDTWVRDIALMAWCGGVWSSATMRPAVMFGSFDAAPPMRRKQTLVYSKPPDAGVVGATTGFRRDIEAIYLLGDWPRRPVTRSSVLRSNSPCSGNLSSPAGRTGHPHAKPVDLLEQLISACPPGLISDPFAGAGSTLLAARAQGRRAIGVEIEERYCEVIAKRLAQGDLFGGAA